MAEKNIEMNVMNESGGYDVLYPKTTPEQAGSLSIEGGTMQGDIILSEDSSNEMGVVSKSYVDNSFGSGESEIKKWSLIKQISGTVTSGNTSGSTTLNFEGEEVNYYVEFKMVIELETTSNISGNNMYVGITTTEGKSIFTTTSIASGQYKFVIPFFNFNTYRSDYIAYCAGINGEMIFSVTFDNIIKLKNLFLVAQYGRFTANIYLYGR